MADTATKIPFQEAAAPSTPAATKVVIYAKSDGLMYSKDDAGAETLMSSGGSGSVATDVIWDAAGDLAVGSGSNTAARLAIGATNGMAVQRVSGAVAWALPQGYEFDYVQKTTSTSVTQTTGAAADTVVTGNAVTYDGSTIIHIEFFAPNAYPSNVADRTMNLVLYDGSTQLGRMAIINSQAANNAFRPVHVVRRLTPTNASHTYSIRAYVSAGTGTVVGEDGASGNFMPCYIRQVKVG
jgi:hypothetical protein